MGLRPEFVGSGRMYEALVIAAPQVPALVVLVLLVALFLKHLQSNQKLVKAMVDDASEIAAHCAKVIEENSKIQGQVLEALRRSNGHTVIEPVEKEEGVHSA